MFCKECGEKIGSDVKFCSNCGASVLDEKRNLKNNHKKRNLKNNHKKIFESLRKGSSFRMKQKDIMESERLATLGDVNAQYLLALCYIKGNGVDENYEKAEKYLRKLAEEGYEYPQYSLANYYATYSTALTSSDEIPLGNLEKAFYWYKKSAAQGNCDAVLSVDKLSELLKIRREENPLIYVLFVVFMLMGIFLLVMTILFAIKHFSITLCLMLIATIIIYTIVFGLTYKP